jgi:hypothetical protein
VSEPPAGCCGTRALSRLSGQGVSALPLSGGRQNSRQVLGVGPCSGGSRAAAVERLCSAGAPADGQTEPSAASRRLRAAPVAPPGQEAAPQELLRIHRPCRRRRRSPQGPIPNAMSEMYRTPPGAGRTTASTAGPRNVRFRPASIRDTGPGWPAEKPAALALAPPPSANIPERVNSLFGLAPSSTPVNASRRMARAPSRIFSSMSSTSAPGASRRSLISSGVSAGGPLTPYLATGFILRAAVLESAPGRQQLSKGGEAK